MKRLFCLIDFETTGLDLLVDFPIEVGVIWCSSTFEPIAHYSALLLPSEVEARLTTAVDHWWEPWAEAAKVHHISPAELRQSGIHPTEAATIISGMNKAICLDHGVDIASGRPFDLPVLVSNNIAFDFGFARKLFALADLEWCFNYVGWDTGPIFFPYRHKMLKVGRKPHSALADACLLMLRLQELLGNVDLGDATWDT
jgi:DNA polymerase III epsilon subunit-like protein